MFTTMLVGFNLEDMTPKALALLVALLRKGGEANARAAKIVWDAGVANCGKDFAAEVTAAEEEID